MMQKETKSMTFDSYVFVEATTLHLMSNNSHVLVLQFCRRHVNSEFGSTICGRRHSWNFLILLRQRSQQCSTL